MYPDIAKRRLIYLYSKILNQRKSYHQEKANQAKKLYKENRLKRLYDPIHRAQKNFLNKIGIYRAKCVTCGENFYEKRKFVKSQCKTCEMKYCENCWRESKHYCLVCNQRRKKTKYHSNSTAPIASTGIRLRRKNRGYVKLDEFSD